MDSALRQSLATGYWTDAVKSLHQAYLLDGETVSVNIVDQSSYYSDEEIGYMRFGMMAIDDYIDLDFEFTKDPTTSDIDVFLGDRVYQQYLGLATIQESWISLDVLGDITESYASNINTFIHEFMHALGIGEPGGDVRWDQDDTAMSYNQGDLVGWRITPSSADYDALAYLWGRENDSSNSSSRYLGESVVGKDLRDDLLNGSSTGEFLLGFGGDDIIDGGGGDDDLFGGYGRDAFVLSQGYDRVFDFTLGTDQILGFTTMGSYQADRHGVLLQDGGSEMLLVGIDFNDFNAVASYSFAR